MASDESLHERLRAGELSAFDLLYARHERPLFGFVYRYLEDQGEAEDVFHETWLEVLRLRSATFDQGGFRAWLYQVARHQCLNRLRSRRRKAAALEQLPAPTPQPSPGESLERLEVKHAVARAVSALPPALSEVYQLRLAGLSYEEMAAVLQIPLGTVKSRMHETLTKLRKEMSSWTAS
jgi:RNA polymerase sigma-70 factor (ECF subfamily)